MNIQQTIDALRSDVEAMKAQLEAVKNFPAGSLVAMKHEGSESVSYMKAVHGQVNFSGQPHDCWKGNNAHAKQIIRNIINSKQYDPATVSFIVVNEHEALRKGIESTSDTANYFESVLENAKENLQ